MAIYSLHHTAIGKTTQARPHTASAHVKYICRPHALRHLEAARFPAKPGAVARLLRVQEDLDRANARVADKLMLALPRELTPEQRVTLVRGFAEAVTAGKAPWLAAFHDKGKDALNPHCHLLIRDRDPKTGRRVVLTSEPGSTERFRALWERHANLALKQAGHEARIDRRTLKAQGIDRKATIHEGPKSREMDARGAAPRSRERGARNGYGAKSETRRINYPGIDNGMSRPAYNRAIRDKETAADYWAAVDADNQKREFSDLRTDLDAHETVGSGPAGGGGSRAGGRGSLRSRPEPRHASRRGSPRWHARLAVGRKMPRKDQYEHYQALLDEARSRLGLADATLNNALQVAYHSPERAKEKLIGFQKAKGQRAVLEQLRDGPQRFGRRPGSLLSLDGYKPGASGRQRDATDARRYLPHLFNEYRKAMHEVETVDRALKDLERGGDGPSSHRTADSPSNGETASRDINEPVKSAENYREPRTPQHRSPPDRERSVPQPMKEPAERQRAPAEPDRPARQPEAAPERMSEHPADAYRPVIDRSGRARPADAGRTDNHRPSARRPDDSPAERERSEAPSPDRRRMPELPSFSKELEARRNSPQREETARREAPERQPSQAPAESWRSMPSFSKELADRRANPKQEPDKSFGRGRDRDNEIER